MAGLTLTRSWDDWVPPSRLLKFDPAGLAKQKQLIEVFKQAKKAKDESAAAAKAADAKDVGAGQGNALASGSGSGSGKKAGGGANAGRKRPREGDSVSFAA